MTVQIALCDSEDKLFSKLDRFLKEKGKTIKVPLNDVLYCEAQGKR